VPASWPSSRAVGMATNALWATGRNVLWASRRLRGMARVFWCTSIAVVAFQACGCTVLGHAERALPVTPAKYCSRPESAPPCGPGALSRATYPFKLFTHCGILGAYFDGRFWRAQPSLTDGSGNPPRGWGNPYEIGTIKLVSREVADFRSEAGRARFVPGKVKYYCD